MRESSNPHAFKRILIVDDEHVNIKLLALALAGAGYSNIKSTNDPTKALELFLDFHPDIVLTDLVMPEMSGQEVIAKLRNHIPNGTYLPILVLTGDSSLEARREALAIGATDFLSKPFDIPEVLLRTSNMLDIRAVHIQLQKQNQMLEERVRQRTEDLEDARLEILQKLALAADYRDDDTGEHARRVGTMCAQIAEKLGFSAGDAMDLRLASPLHDIGKIGIVDGILLKAGKLTFDEFEIMKRHTLIGAQILSGSHFKVLQIGEQIAHFHHERWDGSGYPEGLQGDEIPVEARITAVVDVFDVLTHKRPYKSAWEKDLAVAEIIHLTGEHFDPDVVSAFLEALKDGSIQVNEFLAEEERKHMLDNLFS